MAHQHEHHHDEPGQDVKKLAVLLPHWIEHNEEHAQSFQEWAERARALGLHDVAAHIQTAVERMESCNQALTQAIESLPEA